MTETSSNISIPSSQRVEPGSVNIPLGEFPATSAEPSDVNGIANDTILKLNTAFETNNHETAAEIFLKDNSYWRDHLALSWELRTVEGQTRIKEYLASSKTPITKIEIDRSSEFRSPKYQPIDAWGEVHGIQFYITFETTIGRGQGVIRLTEESGEWKIFTLFTSLTELIGHEEPLRRRRTQGVEHGDDPNRKTWKETRETESKFEEIEPRVLIIGAGQGGLATAARLKMLSIPTLIIDQNPRVGDNWRKRYKQLVLHDPVWYDHLPYLPFPPQWPIFTPKDKLGDFFESYASLLDLNVWTSTTFTTPPTYNNTTKLWTITVTRETPINKTSQTRTFHPAHIVLATGHSGLPYLPSIPGLTTFKGPLLHSSSFPGATPSSSPSTLKKTALIIGSCNSAHDIAHDYHTAGYTVTLLQRSTTCVISSSSITNIALKGLYDEDGPPTEDADLFIWGLPSRLLKTQQVKLTQLQAENDAKTLEGLRKAGFALDEGPLDAGLIFKYFQRGGGYYIDVGTSGLIAEGKIGVVQGKQILRVVAEGVELDDGQTIRADEIVFATGYGNMRTKVRSVFGDEVADRVEDIWGFDDEGEIRGLWRRTGHQGLWMHGGNLALCRYYSRILALQIKASVEGISK